MRAVVLAVCCVCAWGCWFGGSEEVVVYTSLDAEFAEPVFKEFTDATGIRVLPKYDTESTKTVGLTEAIIAEKDRARCDVFWNNEVLHTLRLEQLGLLQAYQPPLAHEFPAMHRSSVGTWHGFAARARVLIVNTRLLEEVKRPRSIHDLTDPKFKGKAGIAKPLFGTTATHAACLFEVWGDEKARQFFREVKQNAKVMSGNKQVAVAVAAGQLAFGLTDTDDAIIELEKGQEVTIIYPDQEADGLGTLFIPNTLSILKDCPHEAHARTLIDFLLSPDVEEQLANSPSAQIPLHPRVQGTANARVQSPASVREMQVDFAAAAARWKEVSTFLRDEFTTE